MKKLQRSEHQRLRPGSREKPQQLQRARYCHFLHDCYEKRTVELFAAAGIGVPPALSGVLGAVSARFVAMPKWHKPKTLVSCGCHAKPFATEFTRSVPWDRVGYTAPKMIGKLGKNLVGVRGFEPPAPASRKQCSTRLSYTPPTRAI
jgi:hypothetical protein